MSTFEGSKAEYEKYVNSFKRQAGLYQSNDTLTNQPGRTLDSFAPELNQMFGRTTPYNPDATRGQQNSKVELVITTEKGTTATVGNVSGAEGVVLSVNQ